jgi:CMP-N,N'-diacetyllegionaminic acid synthase
MNSMIALIPARAGSKRAPGKNVRELGGHPLLAYSVASALESGVFSAVVVSTDSTDYAQIARKYGAEVPCLRPAELSGERSLDIEWVEHMLRFLGSTGRSFESFSILRPTSPFRTADTIRRAARAFLNDGQIDSMRAVERCRQHPGKMWVVSGSRMSPLLNLGPPGRPWHSTPYQALPEVFVQNASLEMARTRCVFELHSIAGEVVAPFVTEGLEGFDINDEDDWDLAVLKVERGLVKLPSVRP